MGVYFERPPKGEKTASAGYYNSAAFCKLAGEAGLSAVDVNGDAFSTECKEEVVKKAKETGGAFDLVVYSLASPRRTDPVDGKTYRACLKPIGAIYKNKTLDTDRKEVKEVTIDPANEQEVADTQKVMGGEDWEADAFLTAVDEAMSRPEALAARLFGIRAQDLLHDLQPASARARLSGLLVGAELAAAKPYWIGQSIAMIGAQDLCDGYAAALSAQHVPVTRTDASQMTLAGLKAAYATWKEPQ